MTAKLPTLFLMLILLLGLAGCSPEPTPTLEPTAIAVEPAATPSGVVVAPTPAEAQATPMPTQPPPAPAAEPTLEPVAAFEEAPCPFDLPQGLGEGEDVECGYLVVPEDRADPGGPTVRLAVAIFRHPDGSPEPDPIIYLEGGPGGSRLELMALSFDRIVEPMFAGQRDIIVFDQRGVGVSEPALDCPALIELSVELLDNEVDGQELTDPEIYDLTLETLLACEEDLKGIADLSAYNTVANAADVNDLRLALGYDQVNLWGLSYGTRLALEVMRNHSEGLRSVVLDSTYPPDVDLYVEAPANADRAFDLLFESCAADEACNAAYPNLRTVFFDTVDRLNSTPAAFQVTDPLARETYDAVMNGDSLIGILFQFLYESEVIPSLPRILYAASQDDFDLVALILGSLIAVRDAVSDGMQFSVQCQEEVAFSSLEKLEAALADYPELASFFQYASPGRFSFDACAEWDVAQASASANEPVTSDIPTLILAGEYDPITPPAWGQRVADTLENGHLFLYPGVGHGASIVAGCPQEMLLGFLENPSTAPDDACIAEMNWPAFVVPGAAAAPVELEPFTSDQFGIQGVIPTNWEEISPGVFARQSSGLDVTLVIAQAAPVSAGDLLDLLTGQLNLGGTPESVGQREANGLTWSLYAVEVQGIPVDMAIAEADGLALLVMLQSAADEHDALYEAVFLPGIDALVPAE